MEVKPLGDEQAQIVNMLEDPMMDPEFLKDTIEGLTDEEFADLLDGFADRINDLETAVAMNDKRMLEFQQKRDEFKEHARAERGIVEKLLRIRGDRKVKTAYYTIGIQKNGGLAPLEIDGDIEDIPNDYLIEQAPKIDRDKVRELLKTQTVPWAHLGERGESLRIK